MSSDRRSIGVAVVGCGWMGRVHAQAYARVRHHFPGLALEPRLVLAADEAAGLAEDAVDRFGFQEATTDWRRVAADPRVAAVSVTTPNFLHREVGTALAEAGKHVWIEKPVGLGSDDARAVAAAVAASGVQGAVGFNYRHVPAVAAAHALLLDGGIGQVTHARFRFFSDYASAPEGALTWRYERARGGSGVLGDLASHAADLVRFLLGDVRAVVADATTFIPQRPRPAGVTTGHALAAGGEPGPVENDDHVAALLRLASGARVVLEASRVAVGEQNGYGFEIHGTAGALFWDFRRMGELGIARGSSAQDQPVSSVLVGPGAGEYGAFQPGAANAMSFDDLKVIEAHDFLRSIADGVPHGTVLADAVASAAVLDAMTESVACGRWVEVVAG